MFSIVNNLKQFTVLSRNSVLKNLCEPTRQISDRRLVRKPLKKFKPTTSMKELIEVDSDDDDFYESKLKEARKIAEVSHKLILPRSAKKLEPAKFATTPKKVEKGMPTYFELFSIICNDQLICQC